MRWRDCLDAGRAFFYLLQRILSSPNSPRNYTRSYLQRAWMSARKCWRCVLLHDLLESSWEKNTKATLTLVFFFSLRLCSLHLLCSLKMILKDLYSECIHSGIQSVISFYDQLCPSSQRAMSLAAIWCSSWTRLVSLVSFFEKGTIFDAHQLLSCVWCSTFKSCHGRAYQS